MAGSSGPVPVLPLDAEGVSLEYARHGVAADPRFVTAAFLMVPLAILSGLCVAVCFAAIAWGRMGALLHASVFATTLIFGVFSGIFLGRAGVGTILQRVLDGIACIGLIGIGIVPLIHSTPKRWEDSGALIGGCFVLLAVTTFRHRLHYYSLARVVTHLYPAKTGNSLRMLGNAKMVIECIWLLCCGIPWLEVSNVTNFNAEILAFPAFLGCFVFGIIWIWMIVSHLTLFGRVRSKRLALA